MSTNTSLLLSVLCGGGIFLLLAGLGVFLIIFNQRNKKKAGASQSWPSAAGQITQAYVRQSTSTDTDGDMSTYYYPHLEYTYTVMGQTYTGKRVAFGAETGYGNDAQASAKLSRFPAAGSPVTVYYDPQNPAEAVLERRAGGTTFMLVAGIICLVLSLCIVCPAAAYFIYNSMP